MKKIIALLLALVMLVAAIPVTGLAASDEATQAAQALYELGLFQGTGTNADGTPNFDLDRTPTRHEAVTMLVRLLGKDAEAQAGTWETPFTDVDDWAKPYVGYAYANGLTTGTSETTFGGADTIDAAQYLTFVLRALGYESGTDFQWDDPWELAKECNLTNTYKYDITSNHYFLGGTDNAPFTRGDIAVISNQALYQHPKGKDERLQVILDVVGITEAKLQGIWRQTMSGGAQHEYVFSGNNYTYSSCSAFTYSPYYCHEAGTFQIENGALKLSYVETSFQIYSGFEIKNDERTENIFKLNETLMETSYAFPAYERVTASTVTDQTLSILAQKEAESKERYQGYDALTFTAITGKACTSSYNTAFVDEVDGYAAGYSHYNYKFTDDAPMLNLTMEKYCDYLESIGYQYDHGDLIMTRPESQAANKRYQTYSVYKKGNKSIMLLYTANKLSSDSLTGDRPYYITIILL